MFISFKVSLQNLWSVASLHFCNNNNNNINRLSLSVFTAIFKRVSRCFLKKLRMMEVVVITGAISREKLQPNHHHQQTNTPSFLQAGYPSCCPTNSVKALKGKYHIPGLGVFQLLYLVSLTSDHSAPGYVVGGLPCLSSSLWCQYPK